MKRVCKFAWQSFSRNKGLSFQVIFIMVVAMMVVSSLFVFRGLSTFLIDEAEKKVDVSVYFKKEVGEQDIFTVRKELYGFSSQIESVGYTSKEQAKEIFLQRHKDDPLYLAALEEVGGNPFLASLNIKAKNPMFYAQISEFLTAGPFTEIIEKVSYYENKTVIERLFALTGNIKQAGLILGIFLIILVFLIIFNTIKLTIFALREEVSTMRLVGASNWFIRGPFIIQGILYGIISLIIVDILMLFFFAIFSNGMQAWLFGFNLMDHFQSSFLILFVLQIIFGFILGGVSSFLAVRKYLKV